MTAGRIELSALWCDQGMAHMLQTFGNLITPVPSNIVLLDFGAETMFKSTVLKVSQAAPAVTAVLNALITQMNAGLTPKLDYVLISHQDTDHWSLLNYLIDAVDELALPMKVGTIIYSGADWGTGALAAVKRLAKYGAGGKATVTIYDSTITSYGEANGTVGSLVTIGDVVLRTLIANAPIAKKSSPALRKNGTSMVVVIDYMAERMILPGDATWETLAEINKTLGAWMTSPVRPVKLISAPHHGSLDTMTSKNKGKDSDLEELIAFTDLVQPEAVVASAGYENSFKHPYLIILKTLGKYTKDGGFGPHKIVVYRLDTSDWAQYNDVTKNIYTTVLGLTSPVEVANYLFTRNEIGFITNAFGFYGPSKAMVSVPSTSFEMLQNTMNTAMEEEEESSSPPDLSDDSRSLTAARPAGLRFLSTVAAAPRTALPPAKRVRPAAAPVPSVSACTPALTIAPAR